MNGLVNKGRINGYVDFNSCFIFPDPCTICQIVVNSICDCDLSCCKVMGDVNGDGSVDIGDLTDIIMALFILMVNENICWAAANVDGHPNGSVDIGDITKFIDYLFISFTPMGPCPCEL